MGEEHRTYHWGADQPTNQRGITVSEAAQALGITQEAVRMRIKRGTLRSEKRAGRVYVLLGPRPTTERTAEQPTDHTEELIATLREQLQAERQAHAEARRIIAGLVERIPQLEPPAEPPGAPSEATEQPGRVEPQPAVGGAQEPAEPRS
jgi:predicted transcriptional regulator